MGSLVNRITYSADTASVASLQAAARNIADSAVTWLQPHHARMLYANFGRSQGLRRICYLFLPAQKYTDILSASVGIEAR